MNQNKLFPGRPNYTGPTSGWFGLLHHDLLYEESHDVHERVEYVKKNKPEQEVETRLHNMIFIDPVLCPSVLTNKAKREPLYADYEAKRKPLYADYKAKCALLYADYEAKRKPLYADYEAKRKPLEADYKAKRKPLEADYKAKCAPLDVKIEQYIRSQIPDCAWNGTNLVFDKPLEVR
jgi:hypothetical protein